MSVLGCTSPAAANYNPAATQDDGSCIWLNNIAGTCYEFVEVPTAQVVDNSFTISMALDQKTLKPEGWTFFHDYFPDAYIHSTKQLLNLKSNNVFWHNKGPKGIYHFNSTPKPFFMDVLFAGNSALNEPPSARYQKAYVPFPSLVLNSVNWISEVRVGGNDSIDDDQRALYLETITAITIWNQHQTTGRIVLDAGGVKGLLSANNRNAEQTWNFNAIRNVLSDLTDSFIGSIFQDFAINTSVLNTDLNWWEQMLMEGKYFIVRFEFDNNNSKQINLHDVDANINKSSR